MEYDTINMNGKFYIQTISTLPSYTSEDERRIVYVEDENKLYYGTDTGWVEPATPESDLKKYNIL